MRDDPEPSQVRPIDGERPEIDNQNPTDQLPPAPSTPTDDVRRMTVRPPVALPAHSIASSGSATMKFCDVCGAAWQPEWVACAVCLQSALPKPAVGPRISLASPLALYFVLLSTFIPGAFLPDTFATTFAISLLDSLIVIIWCVASWREIVPLVRSVPTVFNITGAILLGVLTFTLAHVSMGWIIEWFGIEEIYYYSESFGSEYGWGVVILLICIQPALIEELAFRGIILGGLRTAMDDRDAVIVSAMMFMILHVQVFSIVHLLLMGICAGYLRLKTRSIWPCVALHFTHNSLVLLFEYMQLQ
ncbi:MAG: CPBP family intramembrane metalloprotease [Phycisphaerales bacterium]|nr:CPBP family intramembrane metalloprotease [Phycisphaerales bacterium]MCB9855960.1 CPBP family intramembrane metalloprotease [Phycisphaerales bacterium]MCB9864059.1 CPBP family intramembrane metalloprotease [Phycisphaerales bacterium]